MLENVIASSITLGAFLAIILIIYYIYSFSLVKRRKAYLINLHNEISAGRRIVFAGGIYGKVIEVENDLVTVEVKKGAHLLISRYSISEVLKEAE